MVETSHPLNHDHHPQVGTLKNLVSLKFHHLSLRKKKNLLLSIESWLVFWRDPYIGVMKIPHITGVGWQSSHQNPNQPFGPFFHGSPGIYPINTHYIRCIWGWLLRVPSQGYHHFPYEPRFHQLHEKALWVLIEELGETCDPIKGAFHITSYATPRMRSKFLLSASPPGEVRGESLTQPIWKMPKNI